MAGACEERLFWENTEVVNSHLLKHDFLESTDFSFCLDLA